MRIKVLREEERAEMFYKWLVEEAKKNTKVNKDGLTTISEEDPDFYDTIWDSEEEYLVHANESKRTRNKTTREELEPKAKEIWKAVYPFEEKEGNRARPVLVMDVNRDTAKILSMKITSKLKRHLRDDKEEGGKETWTVGLNDYRHEGLKELSIVCVDKVIEIDKSQFLFKYGTISDKDWKEVFRKFEEYRNQYMSLN